MRRFRYYYWMITSIVKRYGLVILFAAVVGGLSFTQASRIYKLLPKPKPTNYIGQVGLYTLTNLPKDIQDLVSQGLTELDHTGTPQPALALNWQVLDEGKTYIFTLKDNLFWQDGTPLTSHDINYSFQDVEIERPDDKVIIFKLKEAFSPFPGVVSQPIFKRSTKSYAQVYRVNTITGTSEYSITKLKRSGNYIQELTIESKQDKKIYRFFPTESQAITAFKLGEVDILEDINNLQDLQNWNNLDITTTQNNSRYVAVFFNTTNPDLSDKSIRQALTYAIQDKPNDQSRALSPISPDSWAYNPKVKPYEQSLSSAKELLSNINTDIEIELTTTINFVDLAESIKSSWEELGFTVKIRVSNAPDTQNFQTLLIGQQIPKDPDQYLLWHSTQKATNITGYQSPKVDKLLEDGRKELDQQKRKVIYQDFQRFLVEDTPAAFLYHLNNTTVTRK